MTVSVDSRPDAGVPASPSRVVLVTGAPRRIGRALALGFTAAPTLRAHTAEASSPTFADTYDLAELGHKEAVMLKGSNARTTISFGVAAAKVVTQADLEIRYRVS